jgi:hypothetical protein
MYFSAMIKASKQFRRVARLSKLNWAATFVAYCLHVQDINPDYKLDYPINVFFEQNGRSTAIYHLKSGTMQVLQIFVTWIKILRFISWLATCPTA